MNKRVVLIWGIFIVAFAAIGIFGMANQDLLVSDEDDSVYVPVSDTDTAANTKICTATLDNASSSYKFTLDDAGNVIKITITYNTSNGNADAYTSAWELTSLDISGVKTVLSGESESFVLITTVDVPSLDYGVLSNYLDKFNEFNIFISESNQYSNYTDMINAASSTSYQCD